jgi:hypothetical protein
VRAASVHARQSGSPPALALRARSSPPIGRTSMHAVRSLCAWIEEPGGDVDPIAGLQGLRDFLHGVFREVDARPRALGMKAVDSGAPADGASGVGDATPPTRMFRIGRRR